MEEDKVQEISESKTSFFSGFNPRENSKGVLAFLFAALVIISAVAAIFLSVNRGQDNSTEEGDNLALESGDFSSIANSTMVYGYWDGDKSIINAANFNNGNIYEVASLPLEIKKVNVLSPTSLIFISNTNIRDHGSTISSHDLTTKRTSTLVSASRNFGIDDYQISPNKRYLATWEVSIPQGGTLSRGSSRVYTVDLQNPTVKNLIYDEDLSQTTYAHYPVGITDNGEVFMDTFRPNDQIGWANGMSYSNFDGTNVQNIPSMARGTYASQPRMSPDGKYFAFVGYDETLGDGNAEVNGIRLVFGGRNTIELLDTATKTRTKLPGLANTNAYDDIQWDMSPNRFFYSVFSKNVDNNGEYLYDLLLSSSTKLNLPNIGENPSLPISTLGPQSFLVAQYSTEESSVANLGQQYMDSITGIGVYSGTSDDIRMFNLNTTFAQYIGLYDGNYFADSKVVGTLGADEGGGQLQFGTFTIKPTLAPVRIVQQSEPPSTKDPEASPTPVVKYGTNCPRQDPSKCYTSRALECRTHHVEPANCCPKAHPIGDRACMGSPLYLYGEQGKEVEVFIGTPIHNSNAPYGNSYKGILTGTGGIRILGNTYHSLDFDYSSALRRLPRLDYGKTVKKDDLPEVLRDYGKKLGLNEKEIGDTILKIEKEDISSPFVFVSFFSDEASKSILPISFAPQPDVYRNVVFYIKPTNIPIISEAPIFGAYPDRVGFTAVEVSYILD